MSQLPRVALFSDTFDETNGVAHTYRTLASYCERSGLPIDFYVPGAEGDSVESRGSVRILRFNRRMSFEYYDDLHFSLLPNLAVAKHFSEGGPYGLVHIAAPGNLGVWGRKLARKFGAPLVGVHHTQLQDYAALRVPRLFSGLARGGSLQLLRSFYRPCRTVLAPTPKMSELIKKLRIARDSEVFSRGVDTQRFDPRHRTVGESGEACRLLYVGRLAVEKNLGALSRVLQRLRHKAAFEMTFVGDGPMRAELEKALPFAKFAGVRKGHDLAEAYANADVFLFPSLTDTFGNVVNEAQASGVPCVVMDPNGPGEVIEPDRTGVLAPTEEGFVEAAEGLIKDRNRRRAMAESARKLALRRDWDQVFGGLWGFYQRASETP